MKIVNVNQNLVSTTNGRLHRFRGYAERSIMLPNPIQRHAWGSTDNQNKNQHRPFGSFRSTRSRRLERRKHAIWSWTGGIHALTLTRRASDSRYGYSMRWAVARPPLSPKIPATKPRATSIPAEAPPGGN